MAEDPMKRVRANYVRQKERVAATKKRIEELTVSIARDMRLKAKLESELPTYEQYLKGATANLNELGGQQRQEKLSQMSKLREELERLTGEKVPVAALDDVSKMAESLPPQE